MRYVSFPLYVPGYTHSARTGRRFKLRVQKKRSVRVRETLRKEERSALGSATRCTVDAWLEEKRAVTKLFEGQQVWVEWKQQVAVDGPRGALSSQR